MREARDKARLLGVWKVINSDRKITIRSQGERRKLKFGLPE